eukprot:160062_1
MSEHEDEFFTMFDHLFETKRNINDCKVDDVLECQSLKRIKIVLKHCDDMITEPTQITNISLQNKIHDLIHHKLGHGTFNNTSLLDDFHHIKYGHNVDQDIHKFDTILNNLTNKNCNSEKCGHLMRHYTDRTQPIDDVLDDTANDNRYALNLISRIHTYFIHSYDLNKLTVKELKTMNDELKEFQQTLQANDCDYDQKAQQKKLEILSKIMKNKKAKKLTQNASNDKYIAQRNTDDANFVDGYRLFLDIVCLDQGITEFNSFLLEHEYDTDSIYDDLDDDELSNIYRYFRHQLPHKMNQIDLLKEAVARYKPVIDDYSLLDQQQQHQLCVLAQFCAVTNASIGTAKAFLDVTNWTLQTSIDRYYMFDGKVSSLTKIIDQNTLTTDQREALQLGFEGLNDEDVHEYFKFYVIDHINDDDIDGTDEEVKYLDSILCYKERYWQAQLGTIWSGINGTVDWYNQFDNRRNWAKEVAEIRSNVRNY